MRSWMIAFSLGILVCGFIDNLPAVFLSYSLLLIPVLAVKYKCLYLPSAFCLGSFWFLVWAQHGVEQLLPTELEKQDIWLQGKIASLPQMSERSQRVIFAVSKTCIHSDLIECDFSSIENEQKKVLLNFYQPLIIIPGQSWQLQVRLKRPHGFSNPGGFDYESWLLQQGISAAGYVREHEENHLLTDNLESPGLLPLNFNLLRYRYRETLDSLVSDNGNLQSKINHSLIKALTIGDRYNIREQEWKLFTATGTNHLIVVSGLHVGLVTFMVYRISVYLLSIFIPALLCIPAQRSGAALAVLAAFFYAGLAGFSLPAQRAFIMVAVVMMGHLMCRNTSAVNSYCLAMGLVLFLNPLAPQSSGFWLSFGAVGLLLFLASKQGKENSGIHGLKAKVKLLVKTQLYLSIGLLPLMLVFFQQQSLLAPIVNLFAIPYISLLVVPLCLLSLVFSWFSPSLTAWCLHVVNILLECFMAALDFIVGVNILNLQHWPALSWAGLSLLLLVVTLLLLVPGKSRKLYALLALLPLLLPLPFFKSRLYVQQVLQEKEFSLTVLDVGQGLAMVLRTRDHVMVYDVGPAFSPRFDAGEGVVLPYLQSQNVSAPDIIMISHGDNDHVGGLPALLASYPDSHYMAPDTAVFPDRIDSSGCHQGRAWEWNGVSFELLHPDLARLHSYSKNNASCVLKVSVGEYSALLSGDIEKAVERRLVINNEASLNADILIAPHHGSNTSSTRGFIAAVTPHYTVFSSGYLSRFNHPHPLVVERYQGQQTIMLNTSKTGAVTFTVNSTEGVHQVKRYRHTHKRYWYSI